MMLVAEKEEYRTIHFEETELRLGLPGGNHEAGSNNRNNNGKRGFDDTTNDGHPRNDSNNNVVDLKLNLSTTSASCSSSSKVAAPTTTTVTTTSTTTARDSKFEHGVGVSGSGSDEKLKDKVDPAKPPAKAQVVGWPPVRSFRKNIVSVQKKSGEDDQKAAFVKVSMDGAPYLRKVDLKLYKSYQDLSDALGKMFSSFTIGNCGSQGMKDFMNESKLIDLLNGSEYVATYEDKDGDWMLVGDVPWEMFVNSCKRLRIMKGSEAIGLAPRAVEKCKSRS